MGGAIEKNCKSIYLSMCVCVCEIDVNEIGKLHFHVNKKFGSKRKVKQL